CGVAGAAVLFGGAESAGGGAVLLDGHVVAGVAPPGAPRVGDAGGRAPAVVDDQGDVGAGRQVQRGLVAAVVGLGGPLGGDPGLADQVVEVAVPGAQVGRAVVGRPG